MIQIDFEQLRSLKGTRNENKEKKCHQDIIHIGSPFPGPGSYLDCIGDCFVGREKMDAYKKKEVDVCRLHAWITFFAVISLIEAAIIVAGVCYVMSIKNGY